MSASIQELKRRVEWATDAFTSAVNELHKAEAALARELIKIAEVSALIPEEPAPPVKGKKP